MKITEIIDRELTDWQASASLCKSSKPDSALGSSALSSCKSQGLRPRRGSMVHRVGKKRIKVAGKRLRGKKYGGDLPDWSD